MGGCSFFGNEKIKPSSLLSFEETVVVEKAWDFDNKNRLKADGISPVTVPSVMGDNVIIPSRNGVVTVLKLATGQIEERIELGLQSLSQIGVEMDEDSFNFAFVSADGRFMFFNSNNKVLWSTQLNGIVRMAPKIGELGVIVRQEDNKVLAYDKVGGKLLWSISKRTMPLILHAQSDMRFVGDENKGLATIQKDLAVNLAGGELILLNSKTGSVLWEKRLAFPKGQNEVERIVDLLGAPFLDDQEICTSVYQTKLVCADKGTGDIDSFAAADISEVIDLTDVSVGVFTQAIEILATLRADNGGSMSRLRHAADDVALQKTNMIAANGRIKDVDIATESTKLAKYQVLVQASASMLAQANTNTDVALMLLR